MKPSRLQHILAYSVEISAAMGIVAAWACGLYFAVDSTTPVRDLAYVIGFLIVVVLAIPAGAIMGVIAFFPFLQMLAHKLNGAPFKAGDSVEILRGPYRGKITQVYDPWDPRSQVRIVLGEEQKKSFEDVYDMHKVCRVKS